MRMYLEGTDANVLEISLGYGASGVSITTKATEKSRWAMFSSAFVLKRQIHPSSEFAKPRF